MPGLRMAQAGTIVAASVRRTFHPHLPLYALSAAFASTLGLVIWDERINPSLESGVVLVQMFVVLGTLGVAVAAVGKFWSLVRVERPASPLRAMGSWMLEGALSGDRAGNLVHTLIAFVPLTITFSALKIAIPLLHPFAWDETFSHLDAVLHGGHQPWELLQPILGWPVVTFLINVNYNLWFFVLFGVLVWQAALPRGSALRMQFLLSFALAWVIGGNLLAAVFSSAGPCFYGRLGLTPDPYQPLMAYLAYASETLPIWALTVQDTLWQSYTATHGFVAGISAMPSMHVTTSALMAAVAWRTNRRLGGVLIAFAVLILLGSVHLGWHYAVDSYAGLILAAVFWQISGFIVRSAAMPAPRALAVGSSDPATRSVSTPAL